MPPPLNHDILYEIFSHFRTPYDPDPRPHHGDIILSCLLVNKLWASAAIAHLWARLENERPLARLLIIDWAAPQDGQRLKLARCSFNRIKLKRVTPHALSRFQYYASFVAVMDRTRAHNQSLTMKAGEVQLWKDLAERLSQPVFPRLRSLGVSLTPGWILPAIYEGSVIDQLSIEISGLHTNETMIQSLFDSLSFVEDVAVNVSTVTSGSLQAICEPLNSLVSLRHLKIHLSYMHDHIGTLYDALASLNRPYALTVEGVQYPSFTTKSNTLDLSSLLDLNLQFSQLSSDHPSILYLPPASQLRSLRVELQYSSDSSLEDILESLATYRISSPFKTLIYHYKQDLWGVYFQDQPRALLRLANLSHLEITPGAVILVRESFLLSIAEASPNLTILKLSNYTYSLQYMEDEARVFAEGPELVTICGIIRFAARCPKLRVLQLAFNARLVSIGAQHSKCAPHLHLEEICPWLSLIDNDEEGTVDAVGVAALLKAAFPALHTVKSRGPWDPWFDVGQLVQLIQ